MCAEFTIGVTPTQEYYGNRRLFDSLSALFRVKCEPLSGDASSRYHALLLIGGNPRLAMPSIPTFIVASGPAKAVGNATLEFGRQDNVPESFRDARLVDPSLSEVVPLFPDSKDRVVASINGSCVWMCRGERGKPALVSGLRLPRIENDEFLYTHFRCSSWAALLPLLHWLRQVVEPEWEYPKPRAAIIIDDANLHHSTYGYLRFTEIVDHAGIHNYHLAVSTIPLDMWYTNGGAAETFRRNPAFLSLLIHGNNHVNHELARTTSVSEKKRVLAQALRRTAVFEKRTRLKVDRVMAAPHGAIDRGTTDAMRMLGFEAACVSVGSLVRWNPHENWPPAFGMTIAHLMAGGLAVVHRFGLGEMELQARLAAFLGQPIIFTAHQKDCFDGLEILASAARAANAVGCVSWSSVAKIARSCYLRRSRGSDLHVRLFTNNADIPLAQHTARLILETPRGGSLIFDCATHQTTDNLEDDVVTIRNSGRSIEVGIRAANTCDLRTIGNPPFSAWAMPRRFLCEARDRAMPLIRRSR